MADTPSRITETAPEPVFSCRRQRLPAQVGGPLPPPLLRLTRTGGMRLRKTALAAALLATPPALLQPPHQPRSSLLTGPPTLGHAPLRGQAPGLGGTRPLVTPHRLQASMTAKPATRPGSH